MLKIAVFVSGSGSNLQSIIDNIEQGKLNCRIEAVISDNPKAGALERAEIKGIRTYVLDKSIHKEDFGDKALQIIGEDLDLIVLAGFLSILKGEILNTYKNKIINIHPSLIPNFCGKGMYGRRVHEAVIKAKAEITGCTVHYVNAEVDGGAVILQKIVKVDTCDDADTLQEKVLSEEHKLLCKVLCLIEQKKLLNTPQGVKILEEVI
ncbi:phosphoribosylglycinamide formyltransferase [Clostridium polynesiense]|uniref:phosphoribosylglycinamide formyltransferase n=1 Tax=Clostridium polynesiense TaxID=1325933 RepID=UPI00058C7504|nr:phosphoribosylglycinamide formyltransferase [Clostridium polynesiense]